MVAESVFSGIKAVYSIYWQETVSEWVFKVKTPGSNGSSINSMVHFCS